MGRKIRLNDTPEKFHPKTYEEWVEIHGEPEYLYIPTNPKRLEIKVIYPDPASQPVEEAIDYSSIIYKDSGGNLRIDYGEFSDVFARATKIVYCNGVFYTPEGAVPIENLRGAITEVLIRLGWKSKLDVPTTSIVNTLKDRHHIQELKVNKNVIPLENGDLYITPGKWEFHAGQKEHTPYRLSVKYDPSDQPMPLFTKWVQETFEQEDIDTVQEILGYCLVPVTAAQEAFFLVGDAGVGKSGFGVILRSLLGNGYVGIETQSLTEERFKVAELQNRLVAYDDDLGSAALKETGMLKKLITADTPIPAERKYSQPFEFRSYCRIVASANFMLSSLYDDSDGFFRRLHPILVKPRDPNRKTIRDFYDMILKEEKEQILRWALEGLKRLMANGWNITWSQRSRDYFKQVKSAAVPFDDFLDETCNVGHGDISTAELKSVYRKWCRENGIKEASDRRLERWMSDKANRGEIEKTNCIVRNNRRVRGYRGLSIKPEWMPGTVHI